MDENKKSEESEATDDAEKIEVKVNTASDSSDAKGLDDGASETGGDEPEAEAKKTEGSDEESKPDETENEDTAVEVKVEEPTTAEDELVPPPETEESSEKQDEAVSEETTTKDGDSDTSDEQLAPVAAPPQDDQSQSGTDPVSVVAPAGVVPNQPGDNAHPHRNNKKLAVMITVFVGALLAAVAVYVYMSANGNTKETTPTPSPTPQQSTQQTAEPATTDDVDAAAGDVEQAIDSLDDTGEFSEEQLSDESLGL